MGSLHDELLKSGCKADIKLAKSDYVVSDSLNKKTIANYVFCKKGLIARIYTDHINQFEGLLDTLPDKWCTQFGKRLFVSVWWIQLPVYQRRSMGDKFLLKGGRLQRCRNSAFMFCLNKNSRVFVKYLLLSDAKAAI